MVNIIAAIIGTLLTIGLGVLVKGQFNIRKEACEGREKLYNKIDLIVKDYHEIDKRVSVLETHHNSNHPGQL